MTIERCKLRTVLSIAGSDSGGGAGIQADLRAFTALETFGTTAITCITAQNLSGVAGIEPVNPEMVALQIRTVCAGFKLEAVKTGMLYSADIIDMVADVLSELSLPNIVVDPVMIATSGARLLKEDAEQAMVEKIFPLATVITPNVPELEFLADIRIESVDDMKNAASAVGKKYDVAVVAKGGHLAQTTDDGLQTTEDRGQRTEDRGQRTEDRQQTTDDGLKAPEGSQIVDVLWDGKEICEFAGPRLEVGSTHGTGCSFAAAMAATLAKGATLPEAVQAAKAYVADYVSLR